MKTALPSILMLIAAALALFLANSSFYPVYKIITGHDVHFIVNEILMALFFFVVVFEIKYETLHGILRDKAAARLPLFGAIGGMLVPVCFYMIFAAGNPEAAAGWAIPCATDIAFAVGIFGFFKNRVHSYLGVFLKSLAIFDDIGAVIIITLFYAAGVNMYLLIPAIAALYFCHRFGLTDKVYILVLLALLAWFSMLFAGFHPSLAGGLVGMVTATSFHKQIEAKILPAVEYIVIPAFAFVNAGVGFTSSLILDPISLGIVAGLVLGKVLGVTLLSWLAIRSRVAALPEGVLARHFLGVAHLTGIGFTMSIFIAMLSFPDAASSAAAAKVGILIGSGVSAVLGILCLSVRVHRGYFRAGHSKA